MRPAVPPSGHAMRLLGRSPGDLDPCAMPLYMAVPPAERPARPAPPRAEGGGPRQEAAVTAVAAPASSPTPPIVRADRPIPSPGSLNVDWEERWDVDRLRT